MSIARSTTQSAGSPGTSPYSRNCGTPAANAVGWATARSSSWIARAQVLRRLPDVHHFSRVSHGSLCLFRHVHSRSGSPACGLYFRTTPCPQYRLRGLSVFRAYLNPEKPRLGANLRVSLGFLPVSWNSGRGSLEGGLQVVVTGLQNTIRSGSRAGGARSLADR